MRICRRFATTEKGGQRRQARRGKGKEAGAAAGGSGEHGHPLRRAQYAADPEELEDFLAGKPPQDKEEHEEQEEQRDDESFEE